MEWLNDALLKMTWLRESVEWFFECVLGIYPDHGFYDAGTFFVYDVIKIFILLTVLIFLVSWIQSYFSPEQSRVWLSQVPKPLANTLGALLGTLTPFCSCSSIPLFIGFTKAGLPLSVTFSFLISSPLVDLASVILLASIFNWTVAISYVVVGLFLAIGGGTIIGWLRLEEEIEPFARPSQVSSTMHIKIQRLTFKDRLRYAWEQVKDIIRRVWLYVLLGVGIGAWIHGYIPEAWIETVLGQSNPFSVIIATLLGIPMYADIFGTLPIAEALVGKGVELGTVLAFMMSVTALSLPSLILLKKVVKMKLLLTFLGIVTLGIAVIGYGFNLIGFFI